MKLKRSLLNLIFGVSSQLITIGLGLLIPRLFLLNFGSEANGLVSSISQIIVYMSIFEAGVGAASLQALYRPIARGDKQSVSSILSATSIYYKKTGIFYFVAVILLAIIYPTFVTSSFNNITVMLVILLTGIPGAINYYFQGKYRIFLSAEGKDYINSSIVTLLNILNSLIRIILLLNGFDIIAVQASYIGTTILQILFYHYYINKNYKWINLKVSPDLDSISQKNSALIHQISTLVFNNTDVLILTIFTNLKVVSVYVMYNLIFGNIDRIISIVNNSFIFVLGQKFHEKKERFVKLYDAYEVYLMAFVFSVFTIVFILILPFMRLYTLNINDVNYMDPILPILFVTLKLLNNARISSNNLINIAGHFQRTQFRSILESVINLVCSVIFVALLGIYGVLIGTIIALLYRSTDMVIYANKNILKRSPFVTFKRLFINLSLFIIIISIYSRYIRIDLSSYANIIIVGFLMTLVIIPIYFVLSIVLEKEVYNYTKVHLKILVNKFKRRILKNNI